MLVRLCKDVETVGWHMWLTEEGRVLGKSNEDESRSEDEMDGISMELLGLWWDIKTVNGRKRRKELQKEI